MKAQDKKGKKEQLKRQKKQPIAQLTEIVDFEGEQSEDSRESDYGGLFTREAIEMTNIENRIQGA